MKARIKNTNFEVDVFPFYIDGEFVGYTDKNHLGHLTYKKDELIFPNTCQEGDDWSSFRREAAKDILAGFAARIGHPMSDYSERSCKYAIQLADELIKQLKEQ